MKLPFPGVVRNSGPHFDQAPSKRWHLRQVAIGKC